MACTKCGQGNKGSVNRMVRKGVHPRSVAQQSSVAYRDMAREAPKAFIAQEPD